MALDTRKPDVDADGVRVFQSSGRRRVLSRRRVVAILGIAAASVVVLSAAAVVWLRNDPGTRAASQPSAPVIESQRVARRPLIAVEPNTAPPAATDHVDRPARPNRRPSMSNPAPDRATHPAPEAAAAQREQQRVESMAQDFIEGLKATGETEGIAAFPPHGTDPIKPGLVVPDDFELPKGYVRHYQITDDGKRLEPILMFSPDYKFVDANGQPVAPPEDGIVPPDLAPPGLPLRTLDVPKPPRTASGSHSDGR